MWFLGQNIAAFKCKLQEVKQLDKAGSHILKPTMDIRHHRNYFWMTPEIEASIALGKNSPRRFKTLNSDLAQTVLTPNDSLGFGSGDKNRPY